MRKNFVFALVCSLVSVAAFFKAGSYAVQENSPTFAVPALLALACVFLSFTVKQVIKDHDVQNAKKSTLDQCKPYRINAHGFVGDRYIWNLFDLVANRQFFFFALGPAIPNGFEEVLHEGKTFLVPKGKKLAMGRASGFVFTEE
ncbi:MAG: hypothetical protein M0P64_02795 [Candidatus Pacebacteria bacterium]|jgi:hypothetical protein|nr:hypothetical protein [Candidatus Paceibacterota bacterium]